MRAIFLELIPLRVLINGHWSVVLNNRVYHISGLWRSPICSAGGRLHVAAEPPLTAVALLPQHASVVISGWNRERLHSGEVGRLVRAQLLSGEEGAPEGD